jgi:hypothetical protein
MIKMLQNIIICGAVESMASRCSYRPVMNIDMAPEEIIKTRLFFYDAEVVDGRVLLSIKK